MASAYQQIDDKFRSAISILSFVTGGVCLWWGVLWLQTTADSIVPGLDLVLFPLSDLVWVPALGVSFLVGAVAVPLSGRVSQSRILRGMTLLCGGLLLGVNVLLVSVTLNPLGGVIFLSPLTATALLLFGVGATGWVTEE